MAAGVDAFVAKPFDVDLLVETLQRLCRPEETPALPAAPTPPAEAAPAGIDFARGLRLWGSAQAFVGALAKFIDAHGDAGARLETLSPADAAALVHKLRGAAAQLGITPVVLAAQALERDLPMPRDRQRALHQLQLALDEARRDVSGHVQAAAATAATQQPQDDPSAGPAPVGPAAEAWGRLLDALASDEAQRIESALTAAAPYLQAEVWDALRTAVAYYEYRAAEDLVRSAAAAPSHTTES
jgi:HPt (histidine-containing phosphotransfer) domain-containing protein